MTIHGSIESRRLNIEKLPYIINKSEGSIGNVFLLPSTYKKLISYLSELTTKQVSVCIGNRLFAKHGQTAHRTEAMVNQENREGSRHNHKKTIRISDKPGKQINILKDRQTENIKESSI